MRLTWLPEVLRAAGLTVHEVSGWRTRGDDTWGPIRGVTCHATAGARGGSASGEIGVLINGSPTAPPPIAQLYLARNGDWHVVASGKCFHNLVGWAGPNEGHGNATLIGVEAGNDNRGEPWPSAQLRSYERGVAAICRRLAIPASRVAGHKEHQPGDKSDPFGINMSNFRAAVARLIEGDEVELTDQVDLNSWIPERWPDDALSDGKISVGAALGSSYGHARAANDQSKKALQEIAVLRGEVAGLTTLVQQLATADPVPLTDEQVRQLTDAVVAAAAGAAEEALERTRLVVDDTAGP